MDELIIKHLRGEATDIESRRVGHWRAESADNEAEYRSLSELWELGRADPERPLPPPPALSAIVREAERRRRRARAHWRSALRSPWTGYGLAAAAVVALLLARVDGSAREEGRSLTPTESTASAGDVVTMSLSDGSVVRLAAASRVEFPPSPDERLVRLSGRAFFAVAEGERPFVVRTSLGDVTVHGTRFEVTASGEELRLVVVEGEVSLEGPGGEAVVGAGQVAHLRGRSAPAVVDASDVWSLLEWIGGLLVFQETPMADVGSELARQFGLPVSVAPGIGSRRITAWFADEPADEVLSAICLVAGAATCELGPDSISIGP